MIANGLAVQVNEVAEEAAWDARNNELFHQVGETILQQLGLADIRHFGKGLRRMAGYVIGRLSRAVTVEFRRAHADFGAEIEIRELQGRVVVIPNDKVEDLGFVEEQLRSFFAPSLFDVSPEPAEPVSVHQAVFGAMPVSQIALF